MIENERNSIDESSELEREPILPASANGIRNHEISGTLHTLGLIERKYPTMGSSGEALEADHSWSSYRKKTKKGGHTSIPKFFT